MMENRDPSTGWAPLFRTDVRHCIKRMKGKSRGIAIAVLSVLATEANKEGFSSISDNQMADMIGCTPAQAKGARRKLVSFGAIEVTSAGGPGQIQTMLVQAFADRDALTEAKKEKDAKVNEGSNGRKREGTKERKTKEREVPQVEIPPAILAAGLTRELFEKRVRTCGKEKAAESWLEELSIMESTHAELCGAHDAVEVDKAVVGTYRAAIAGAWSTVTRSQIKEFLRSSGPEQFNSRRGRKVSKLSQARNNDEGWNN